MSVKKSNRQLRLRLKAAQRHAWAQDRSVCFSAAQKYSLSQGYLFNNSKNYWIDVDELEVWVLHDAQARPKDWHRLARTSRESQKILAEYTLQVMANKIKPEERGND